MAWKNCIHTLLENRLWKSACLALCVCIMYIYIWWWWWTNIMNTTRFHVQIICTFRLKASGILIMFYCLFYRVLPFKIDRAVKVIPYIYVSVCSEAFLRALVWAQRAHIALHNYYSQMRMEMNLKVTINSVVHGNFAMISWIVITRCHTSNFGRYTSIIDAVVNSLRLA